ncbi:phosphoribosylaminoimidazolesuccinocarboxamide synthase [Aerococcaceae bacterium WGS1372]
MKLIYQGKTKDIYQASKSTSVLKFKDDVTGVDGVFDPGANQVGLSIDGMGHKNLALTTYFFKKLKQAGIPTHFIETNLEDNTMTVKTAKVFGQGLEVITRYKATGSFVRRYGAYIQDGAPLDQYVEFTLKDDEREDPLINFEGLITLKIMTEEQYQFLYALNLKVTDLVRSELEARGIDLYDIKLEFGYLTKSEDIVLIDEISAGNMRAFKDGKLLDPIELSDIFLEL